MKKLVTLMLLAGALSQNAAAESVPALIQILEDQVSAFDVEGPLSTGEGNYEVTPSEPTAKPAEYREFYMLRNLWVRIRAIASFSLPGLVKIEVVPETEMLVQQTMPEGMAMYKP